ncbi:MAG: hypothetical protein K9H49_02995 [Bacteroidales bacterium]|nr:hypothetical protein [Bacteroidales bacterium]MCF8389225.1 hypothetical protein [Bacteroidales bacterium]
MFFRLLLIILLVYVIVRFLTRLFSPPANSNTGYQNQNKEKEGSITIKDTNSNKQKINKAEGDYVDFEDV